MKLSACVYINPTTSTHHFPSALACVRVQCITFFPVSQLRCKGPNFVYINAILLRVQICLRQCTSTRISNCLCYIVYTRPLVVFSYYWHCRYVSVWFIQVYWASLPCCELFLAKCIASSVFFAFDVNRSHAENIHQ